jgi:hypothetical protein
VEPIVVCNFGSTLEIFRSQTTKGIWLAKAKNIEPCTLVMDLEGTDGRERGEVMKMKTMRSLFLCVCVCVCVCVCY